MNTRLATSDLETEMTDLRHDAIRIVRRASEIAAQPDHPMPLWLKARAHTISFRRDDLVRTHWQKVWRSMIED